MFTEGSPHDFRITRDDFGSGKAGERAWQMISEGVLCEAIQDESVCGKQAIGTTDIDVLADLSQIPHCSLDCHTAIVDRVELDLAKTGRTFVPGRNGFGRA